MERPRVLLRRHRKGSQERNCLKIIEHIGQIQRGVILFHRNFPNYHIIFPLFVLNLGAMKSYVHIFVFGFVC